MELIAVSSITGNETSPQNTAITVFARATVSSTSTASSGLWARASLSTTRTKTPTIPAVAPWQRVATLSRTSSASVTHDTTLRSTTAQTPAAKPEETFRFEARRRTAWLLQDLTIPIERLLVEITAFVFGSGRWTGMSKQPTIFRRNVRAYYPRLQFQLVARSRTRGICTVF